MIGITRSRIGLTLLVLLVAAPDTRGQGRRLEEDVRESLASLPIYRSRDDASSHLRSIGSSTLSNLLLRWEEEFKEDHSGFSLDVRPTGSSTAPAALTSGAAELAPMSRRMSQPEIDAFVDRHGHPPLEVVVVVDAIAVYVNRDNPVDGLSLTDLDAIFSTTRRRGGDRVSTWGDLGITGALANERIRLFGHGETAGARDIFKELVMEGGEWRSSVRIEPGSSSLVNAIGAYPGAIGYASQFFRTRRIRAVPIGTDDRYIELNYASCIDGSYPLTRALYIYVNKPRDAPLPATIREFLIFICSRRGQEIAALGGNYPIDAGMAQRQLRLINE
ncbi:MAG: PstS family phosphate ABC transporter substrate-binding protein [Planctomycetota bacterium]